MGLYLKDLIFGDQAENPVLEISDLKAEKGEIISVVGPQASGKSVLLALIAGALRPQSGSVVFKVPKNQQWNPVGYRPEGIVLAPKQTVGSYLMFVCQSRGFGREQSRKAVLWVLRQLELEKELETFIGHLNPCRAAIVSIAGAIVASPEVLVVDEAYAGLDDFNIWRLNRCLTSFAEDRLVILSTRNLTPTPRLSRYWFLVGGRIAAVGSKDLLLSHAKESVLIEYYRKLVLSKGRSHA